MITSNQKPTKDIQLKERNPNKTLKKTSKPQGKRSREEERNRELEKQLTKWQEVLLIKNHFKYKRIK